MQRLINHWLINHSLTNQPKFTIMEAKKSNILTENVAWAIKIIKTDKSLDVGIKDIDLAKILGTNKDTLAAYRNKKGLLKGIVIERLVSVYNFNPIWLLKGAGEPFPIAREKYPEVCGPEDVHREAEKQIDKIEPLYNKVGSGMGTHVKMPEVEYNAGVNLKDKLIYSQEKIITYLEKEITDLKTRLKAFKERPEKPIHKNTEKKVM